MTDALTYCLKIDSKEYKIADPGYKDTINLLFRKRLNGFASFKVHLVDQANISSDMLDTIVNRFIDELYKENRCFAINLTGRYWADVLETFICTSLRLINQDINAVMNSGEYACFDIFNYSGSFKVFLKYDQTVKEKYDDFMNLGPDYLMGNLLSYYDEIVPAYFLFLYECDAFDNPEFNNLARYQIGLH